MTRRASVPPENFGTPEWIEWRKPLMDVAAKRTAGTDQTPEQWADDYLLKHEDAADLRALGYCAECGRPGELRAAGRCVYFEPCGHHRAQGDIRKMLPYMERRRATMSPERRAALLALIGREAEP